MLLEEAGPVRDMAGLDEGTPLFAQIADLIHAHDAVLR